MTVLKKAVLDSTTTEVARRFQFQAFDLDGNGTISKSEMDMMMTLVRGAPPTPEEVEEVMVKADPAPWLHRLRLGPKMSLDMARLYIQLVHLSVSKAHTGNIPFPAFASWADAGGMTEEELNHVEVLGIWVCSKTCRNDIAKKCERCKTMEKREQTADFMICYPIFASL